MALDARPQFQPAPWTLRGDAVLAAKLVRKDLVQSLVPADARVICVWPGRTLAVLYLAHYRQSPVGAYRELIVAPALVRLQGHTGAWISHILVDSEPSMIAGRSIWALPKELASMQWESTSQAQVRVDAAKLNLHARFPTARRSMPLPFVGTALSSRGNVANSFVVRGAARVGITRAAIDLTAEADLQALAFHGPRRMYICADLNITIGPPRSD
jgi:hypothetical protein